MLGVDAQSPCSASTRADGRPKDGLARAGQLRQECPQAEVAVSLLGRQALLQQLTLRGEGVSCMSEVITEELNDMTSVMSLHR